MTDKKATSWLLQTVGKYKVYILLLVFLQAIVNGGAICYALVMKQMVDSAVEQNQTNFVNGLITFVLLMLLLIFIRIVLRQIEESVRSGMENRFKERLFQKLLSKDYAQVNRIHSEDWMNRMTSDTAVCANGMTDIFPGIIGMLVRMVGALSMMLLLQPKLAYILIPGGSLFVLITLILRKYLKSYHKKVQEKDGTVRVYLQERISSMLIVRTFGAERQVLSGARTAFTEHKQMRMQKALISNFCNTGFSFAINGMYLIGIGYCGFGILHGVVSYGTLTAIMQLIGQLQAPLSGISGFVPRFYAMLASAERLMEIEEFKDVPSEHIKTVTEAKELYDKSFKKIVFDEISFDYRKENDTCPVLRDISLSVQKGDYVAITGASGCGKSTLLKLLMGIYEPKSGAIQVVLDNGNRMPVIELKKLFAYVPQGHFLMRGTIRDVITFGRKEESEYMSAESEFNMKTNCYCMTVEKALQLACGEFVFDLPNGLDTLLGEKGAGLSEGQMQRIAIARALYTDAPILILDEATSALDNETEKTLLSNLKQLTDKTVFIITHRPEALRICTRRVEFAENGIYKELEVTSHEKSIL